MRKHRLVTPLFAAAIATASSLAVASPGCGPKWRTFAVTSHERNHDAVSVAAVRVSERAEHYREIGGA